MESRSFQGRGRSGFSREEPRKMYKATCSDCGKDTEVPFEPDPERPVYCRDCLQKHRPPRR